MQRYIGLHIHDTYIFIFNYRYKTICMHEHFKNIYHIANFIAYFYFFESKIENFIGKKMIIYIFLLKTLFVGTPPRRI